MQIITGLTFEKIAFVMKSLCFLSGSVAGGEEWDPHSGFQPNRVLYINHFLRALLPDSCENINEENRRENSSLFGQAARV